MGVESLPTPIPPDARETILGTGFTLACDAQEREREARYASFCDRAVTPFAVSGFPSPIA